jgi:hypothetical protein
MAGEGSCWVSGGGCGMVVAGGLGESLRTHVPWGGQRVRRKGGPATYLVGLPIHGVSPCRSFPPFPRRCGGRGPQVVGSWSATQVGRREPCCCWR